MVKPVSNKPTRRQLEMERHRDEIMSAAEKLFAQKGYVSASMDEVARLSDFSVGTLYNFFKNKEDLYSAIMRKKTDLMQSRIVACLERRGTAIERIRGYFRERMDLYWKYPNFFRLFLHQTMSSVSDPRTGFLHEMEERYEILLAALDSIFESGIRSGDFRRVSPTILTTCMEAIIRGHLVQLSLQSNAIRSQEAEDALFDVFATGAQATRPSNSSISQEAADPAIS